jgi:hypothetical protein
MNLATRAQYWSFIVYNGDGCHRSWPLGFACLDALDVAPGDYFSRIIVNNVTELCADKV